MSNSKPEETTASEGWGKVLEEQKEQADFLGGYFDSVDEAAKLWGVPADEAERRLEDMNSPVQT